MKAESLRVGNFVKHRNIELQVCQIFVDSFQGMFVGGKGSYTYENSDAIPLTEEWLVKFGFNRNDNKQYSDSFYHIKLSASELQINPDNGVVWIYNPIGHSFNNPLLIEYVHQLQNLYFALTGEELTPNKTDKK